MKLDIGSGPIPREGFIGVDMYPPNDGVSSIMGLLPFPDCSIEEVYSSHALEHISKHAVVPTLIEWRRVLIWGGKIVIEVPDLVWVCENWLKYKSADWNLDAIFGDQSDDGQYHKTGFTKNIMFDYLVRAGFTNSVVTYAEIWSHAQNCLVFEVVK